MDKKRKRKLEILRILREGPNNPRRVDGAWDLEGFVFYFGCEDPEITADALEELVNEISIFVNNLGFFEKVN